MERLLLGAMLRSRNNFNLIRDYVVPAKYSKEFQILLSKIGEYYTRDVEVNSVEPEVLYHQIAETIRSEKHQETFRNFITESAGLEIPEQNIKDIVLKAKIQEKGDELAAALANGSKNGAKLAQEYLELAKTDTLENLEAKGVEVVEDEDLETLIAEEFDKANHLILYPMCLNERLDGGVKGGHHITLFGRPEAAKTATAITMAAGFCRQGASGIYIGNEDRRKDLVMRFISNLSGMAKREIEKNPKRAIELAEKEGFRNAKIVAMSPGTPAQIEALVAKYLRSGNFDKEGKPKWIVVDQLRNLNVANDSRVNQLEAAATAMRNIGKKYNLVVVDVTQAGDSGADKAVLEMGDIDFSNTGIPAQADLLLTYEANMAMQHSDVMIAIGARFDDRVIGNPKHFSSTPRKIIHIDIDPSSISKRVKVDIPIVGNVKEVLQELLAQLDAADAKPDSVKLSAWWKQINEWRKRECLKYTPSTEVIKPQSVIEKVWEITKGDAFITSDVGQHQMWAAQYYPFDKPRRWINSGGLGTMGVGLPYAMGVQMANPGATVACITGEASIQMCIQELATCKQYHLTPKIILLNNRFLGMVRQWQQLEYGSRYSESYMDSLPDFDKLVESYGHVGITVDKPGDLDGALKEAFAMKDRLVFMNIITDQTENVWPMVKSGKGLTEMLLGSEDL